MEKEALPHETRFNDIEGVVSLNFRDRENFNFIGRAMAGYDAERFEAIALRVYYEAVSPIVTLYAIDKLRKQNSSDPDKLPVHKFKMQMTFEELFSYFKQFDFTVATGDYKLENMEVVNK
jgi:hypothetical protein